MEMEGKVLESTLKPQLWLLGIGSNALYWFDPQIGNLCVQMLKFPVPD